MPEASIVQVITEASPRMSDAKYITGRVDRLMRAQPSVSQYVLAHQKELTTEGVVSVLFHVTLLQDCVATALGRLPSRVSYGQLDAAARTVNSPEDLARSEADLASFIVSNVELQGPTASNVARKLLSQIAMALLDA